MFGLTKREQRWKAEQKASELMVSLATAVVEAVARVRIAEAEAECARLAAQDTVTGASPSLGESRKQ
jgi:hypothetical protein